MKLPKFSFKKVGEFFKNLPLVRRTYHWSKTHSFPGFFRVPIYDVIIFVINELKRYDLITRANSIAYSFFLSVFPSLIALFTAIPLIKTILQSLIPDMESFDLVLETEIKRIMPGIAGDRLFDFVEDITSQPRFALLSIGFLAAIFFASNGMLALMRGFEKSYVETFKKRKGWKKRVIAILLIISVGGMLVSSIILILLGRFIIEMLQDFSRLDQFTAFLLNSLRWLAIILMFYTCISLIYRYGASTRRRFRMFTPGAGLATLLCILTSVVFSFYVNNWNTYNQLYGSIGTIIVLMIWIQLNSLFILIGFELNASIAINRDLKETIEEENEEL